MGTERVDNRNQTMRTNENDQRCFFCAAAPCLVCHLELLFFLPACTPHLPVAELVQARFCCPREMLGGVQMRQRFFPVPSISLFRAEGISSEHFWVRHFPCAIALRN